MSDGPWFEEPKPILRRTGSGFDAEARFVTPEHEPAPDDWPPVFTSGQPHSGMPPSPR